MSNIIDALKAQFTCRSITLVDLAEKKPKKYLDIAIKKITNKSAALEKIIDKEGITSNAQSVRRFKYNMFLTQLNKILVQRKSDIVVDLNTLPLPRMSDVIKNIDKHLSHSEVPAQKKNKSEADLARKDDVEYVNLPQAMVQGNPVLTAEHKSKSEANTTSQADDVEYDHADENQNTSFESESMGSHMDERSAPNIASKPKTLPKPDMASKVHDRLGCSDNKNPAYSDLKNKLVTVNVPNAMFTDVPYVEETLVYSPDGVMLPANEIKVNNDTMAIATQYPTNALLNPHLKMLASNNTPVIVILAAEPEIIVSKLIPYFSQDGQYGDVKVESSLVNSDPITSDLGAKQYLMTVKSGESDPVNIPVLHVTDWPDKESIDSNSLHSLNQRIDAIVDNSHIYNNIMGHPVVHCRAGVGRTGQLLAARALMKNDAPSVSLVSVVKEMRESRSPLMVQRKEQLDGLIDFCKIFNKRLM